MPERVADVCGLLGLHQQRTVSRHSRFEIDDEPVSGVPPPIGVVAPVHQVGVSNTDSVEFHAIHTPGASHGSERTLSLLNDPMILPTQCWMDEGHPSGFHQFGPCGFCDHVPFQGMHHEITSTFSARGVWICDVSELGTAVGDDH